jgi:hypothetical protein
MPAPPFSGGGDDPKRAVVESQMGVRSSSSRSRWVRVAAPLNPGAGNARTRRLPSVLRMPQSRHNTTESSDVAIDERAVHRSGHLPGQRWGEQVMPPEEPDGIGVGRRWSPIRTGCWATLWQLSDGGGAPAPRAGDDGVQLPPPPRRLLRRPAGGVRGPPTIATATPRARPSPNEPSLHQTQHGSTK